MTLIEQVTAICRELVARGFDNIVVAGGFARDVALGVEPRDADVMVCGLDPIRRSVLRDTLEEYAIQHGLRFKHIPSYGADGSGDFAERVSDVHKVGNVDVVVYRDEHNWMEVIRKFDFNLNQFYFPSSIPRYEPAGEHARGDLILQPYLPVFTADSVRYLNDVPLIPLKPCRRDFSRERLRYISSKYSQLWNHIVNYVDRGSNNADIQDS